MSMYNNPGLAATDFKCSMCQVNRVFIFAKLLAKTTTTNFG